MDFRPIPDHPDYEASRCGIIRRKGRPSKTISRDPIPPRVLNPVASKPAFVTIGQKWLRWDILAAAAWDHVPACLETDGFDAFDPWKNGRPLPIERGAKVITLAEHLEALRSR